MYDPDNTEVSAFYCGGFIAALPSSSDSVSPEGRLVVVLPRPPGSSSSTSSECFRFDEETSKALYDRLFCQHGV